MHRAVPGQSFQTFGHVDDIFHLLIRLIGFFQLRVHLQRLRDGNVRLLRNHLRDGVHKRVGQVHDPAHIPDHAPGRQRSEGHDLHHPVLAVFADHIINDLLPSFKAEVHVDIGHGHTLRIEEPLEQKLIPQGIDISDPQAVRHDAARGGAPSRSDSDPVILGIFDKVPHDQEIIHIPHILDRIQLVFQPFPILLSLFAITLIQPFIAQFVQIFPGGHPIRHVVLRQLGHAELNLHMAAVSNLLCILHCLPRIRKQRCHLFLRFDIVLPAFIAHPVLIRQLFSRLDTEQDVMGLLVLRIGVMHVIGGRQLDPQLLGHLQQTLVHKLLLRNTVVLQLQEIIALPENVLILQRLFLRVFVQPPNQVSLHLPGKAGAQCNDPLMVLPQKLLVHTGLIIISVHKPFGHDLHQIGIAGVILRQKDQMIITVVPARDLPVEPGTRRHIDLASKDGIDPCFFCFPVKVDHPVHDSVVRDRRAVHAQFLYPCHIFRYFV